LGPGGPGRAPGAGPGVLPLQASAPHLTAPPHASAPHLAAPPQASAPHLTAPPHASAPHLTAPPQASAPHLASNRHEVSTNASCSVTGFRATLAFVSSERPRASGLAEAGDAPNSSSNGNPEERCGFTSHSPKQIRRLRIAELASRQFGRITWAQLRQLGLAEATVHLWVGSGYLIPTLPRVYAVGHLARSQESDLMEAVLFAGPGAALSHGTAAWWRGLLRWPVKPIHVSTPRDIKSRRGLQIHGRRSLERETVRGLPVTTIAQTMLDLAASADFTLVRRALAELDFTGEFEPAELRKACTRRLSGTVALARALDVHLPELAQTRSELEVEFVLLCERYGIPRPLMNRNLHGVEADAWWPDFSLVVELDGDGNHRKAAQRAKDRRKEVVLRQHGLTVLRYDYDLVMRTPRKVTRDLLTQMRRDTRPAARDANTD
jgi:hypothetical protein